jgi:glycine cleavage system aminomethyltransferase T/glycine/D-amino acid oxidase-like deaminating enzyme
MSDEVDRARAVVIGGGVTGCSVALHLARAGWSDVVLLDKGELTSGSTCHAAGLVTMYNPSPTMMRFRRYSIELYNELGVFDAVGSLRIAASPPQLKELQRGVSRARGIGLDVDLVGAAEAHTLLPAASEHDLLGGVWMPGDGHLDPHTATYGLAAAARALGARIRTNVLVTGFERGTRGEIVAVLTDHGRIETEVVVNAAGLWAPRLAAMAGGWLASTPVDHQHVALKAVPGWELPRDMPCFRDPDNLVYGRSEHGGVVFGGYEPNPSVRWIDGAPWSHGNASVPPDQERFEPLMLGAIRRFPFLEDAQMIRLIRHPDAMTPDANPLLGPMPGIAGLFVAAGLSLNGFGGAGGIGKTVAEWIVDGEPEWDVTSYRAWRFGPGQRDPVYTAEQGREAYRYYYLLRYPFDADELGRPRRTSALHSRLQDEGAVFVAKHGWERAERFEPGRPWRRAGPDQRAWGWGEPPWLARVGEEHRAVRERAGLLDLSSFGKIEVAGPGALALLERVSTNRIDRPAGLVVYSLMTDRRGGIISDVTVTRLAEDRFRVATGAAAVDADLGWLRAHVEDADDVQLRDVSDELAVIGLWGSASPEVLEAVAGVDPRDCPPMGARTIHVGGASVSALGVCFAGGPGWELWVDPGRAVETWDRLRAAGRDVGLEPVGYRAIDSLRMEAGYRALGTDLTGADTPWQAGLNAFVSLEERRFVGSDALADAKARPEERRLCTLAVGETAWEPVYGGEAVYSDGEVVGRVRSAAYGFAVGRNLATAYLPVELGPGSGLRVDLFGDLRPAIALADAPLRGGRTTA